MDTKTQRKILNPKLLQHKCKIADHNMKQKLKEKRIKKKKSYKIVLIQLAIIHINCSHEINSNSWKGK